MHWYYLARSFNIYPIEFFAQGGRSFMKFTPIKFQASLAAGGVALMAFNYLQFAIPHGKGLIKLSDISFTKLTLGETSLYLPLIGIMLAFTLANLILTIRGVVSLLHLLLTPTTCPSCLNPVDASVLHSGPIRSPNS